jgi:catechol 2,3-dioxygenase-like lactoylglutathione lyase family enzyme
MTTPRVLEQLAAGQLFQIGIVVADLRRALDRYSKAFGLDRWIGYYFTPDNVRDFCYRGRPAEYTIELAMTAGGSPQVELLQIHGRHSLYHEWIREHGYGVQHLGVRVADIQAVSAEMAAAGYPVLQSGHGYGADGDGAFAYFDTLADFGIIVEAIQPPKARRPPDFTWPTGG